MILLGQVPKATQQGLNMYPHSLCHTKCTHWGASSSFLHNRLHGTFFGLVKTLLFLCTIMGYCVCFFCFVKEFCKKHDTMLDFCSKNRFFPIVDKFKRPRKVQGNIISSLSSSSNTWTPSRHCYSRSSNVSLRGFRNGENLKLVVLAAANHIRLHSSGVGCINSISDKPVTLNMFCLFSDLGFPTFSKLNCFGEWNDKSLKDNL